MTNAKTIKSNLVLGMLRIPTMKSSLEVEGDIKKIIEDINNSHMHINESMELQSIQTDVEEDNIDHLKPYSFKSNVEIEDFFKMTYYQQSQYYINPKELDQYL